jgi:hypothetical protein
VAAVNTKRLVCAAVVVLRRPLERLLLVEPRVVLPVPRQVALAGYSRRVEPVRDPVGELRLVVRRQRVPVADNQVVRRRRPRRAAVEEVLAAEFGGGELGASSSYAKKPATTRKRYYRLIIKLI